MSYIFQLAQADLAKTSLLYATDDGETTSAVVYRHAGQQGESIILSAQDKSDLHDAITAAMAAIRSEVGL